MVRIDFYKYHGTGNDFVMVDGRKKTDEPLTAAQIKNICDRHFGVGADGLIILKEHADAAFEMLYYNADGNLGSMCGNGARCAIAFAYQLGIKKDFYHFKTYDGYHEAEIISPGLIKLRMHDVLKVQHIHADSVLNTGSPHYVKAVSNVKSYDVTTEGKKIRNSEMYSKDGINVNFVEQQKDNKLFVRTYERGVEAETLSCGTGVTASALINAHNINGFNHVEILTPGGALSVEFMNHQNEYFTEINLIGPAKLVFEGTITI